MKSVQELIALGKVPSDTVAAKDRPIYPEGWPIFSDLKAQIKFDWDNLPSDRVRMLKGQPEYKEALEAFLLEPATPVNASTTPPSVTLAVSPEDLVAEPVQVQPVAEEQPIAEEQPVVEEEGIEVSVEETPVAEVPSVSVVVEIAEGEKDGDFIKTKDGWSMTVPAVEGSGVQVYTGKTQQEVASKVLKAQTHATALIRKLQQEKEQMLLNEPADVAVERKALKPRAMTADEQFEFAEAIASGDPTRVSKAMAKRDEIIFGGSPAEVIGRVTEHETQLERESYMAIAKAFLRQNPDIRHTKELGDKIDNILLERSWAYTVRNLNKALAELKSKSEVELIPTPVEEAELPVPAASREAAPAPVAAQPVAKPAAAKVPAAVQARPAATPKPVAKPFSDGERLRPGSASTGLSPRQASVRPGVAPTVKKVELTAEEYNRMPYEVVKRRYKTDSGFKSAVDALIDAGKI
jgi:hypothetical protein